MLPEIKFCGITRPEDAREAVRLGARYVGAIFAGGPRLVDGARAAANFRALPRATERVGVFLAQTPDEIAGIAKEAGLAIVQLHGDPDAAAVAKVRGRTGLAVWAAVRIDGARVPDGVEQVFGVADAIVLDTRVAGAHGGTGTAFEWERVADHIAALRASTPLVLAGGLTPDNVARAIGALRPDVVDVSSGVESAPGIKDHARMQAFTDAVRLAGASR